MGGGVPLLAPLVVVVLPCCNGAAAPAPVAWLVAIAAYGRAGYGVSGCGAVPGGALASLARYALCVPVVRPRPKQRAPASSSVG